MHVLVVVERDAQIVRVALRLDVAQFARKVQCGEVVVRLAGLGLHGAVVGALRTGQVHAVDEKVVAFCLTAEHRVVVEHERAAGRMQAPKMMRRTEPGESCTDDDQVVLLPRVDRIGRCRAKASCADLVRSLHEPGRVAVRVRVVAEAAGSVPVVADGERVAVAEVGLLVPHTGRAARHGAAQQE